MESIVDKSLSLRGGLSRLGDVGKLGVDLCGKVKSGVLGFVRNHKKLVISLASLLVATSPLYCKYPSSCGGLDSFYTIRRIPECDVDLKLFEEICYGSETKSEHIEMKKQDTYVLLVKAGREEWQNRFFGNNWSRDILETRDCLINSGVPSSQIYVVDNKLRKKLGSRCFRATKKGLKKAVERLGGEIRENKPYYFVLYVTGHGNRERGRKVRNGKRGYFKESKISMCDGRITAEELDSIIGDLEDKSRVSINVFTTCNPADFSREFGKKNRIAIAGSRGNKLSMDAGRENFVPYFFPALFGQSRQADTNDDGKVSVREALRNTARRDVLAYLLKTYTSTCGDRDPAKVSFN